MVAAQAGVFLGVKVTNIVDVISAECVLGINIIKDTIAALRDVFGGRSGVLQNSFRAARSQVMSELRREAFSTGAEAVVGIDFAYNEISGIGKSMLFVVVTGTALKLRSTQMSLLKLHLPTTSNGQQVDYFDRAGAPDFRGLKFPNRAVRARMPGVVAGGADSDWAAPYAD